MADKKVNDPYAEGMGAAGKKAGWMYEEGGPKRKPSTPNKKSPKGNRASEIESMKKLAAMNAEDKAAREYGKKGSRQRNMIEGIQRETNPTLRFGKAVVGRVAEPFAKIADAFTKDTEPKEKSARPFKNGGMIDRSAVRGKTKGKIC